MKRIFLSLLLVLACVGQAGAAEQVIKYRSINGNEYDTLLEARYYDALQPIIEDIERTFNKRTPKFIEPGDDLIRVREAAAYVLAVTRNNCFLCHLK